VVEVKAFLPPLALVHIALPRPPTLRHTALGVLMHFERVRVGGIEDCREFLDLLAFSVSQTRLSQREV
jgi:hypothetical protein